MAIGVGKNDPSLQQNFVREGYGRPHNLFLTKLASSPLTLFTTFFDYGSPASYVSRSLAKRLQIYNSTEISKMSGIGGQGPLISQDAIIQAQFVINSINKQYSNIFTVSVGVTPDGTFPADLTLGQTLFHALGVHCKDDGSIQLRGMLEMPIIYPHSKVFSLHEINQMSLVSSNIKWHPSTPAKYHSFYSEYNVKFPQLFDRSLRRTDKLSNIRHNIPTGNHAPIKLPPRRYSPAQQDAIRNFCKAHEGTLIQKSTGPWASPLLLIPKKPTLTNNQVNWRVCVDYRELNKITKKYAHPLPYVHDEIQRAAGHKFFAFLDLENGFWHIRMNDTDREKTAFVTPFGIYEWLVMPFGLCNAPATFQNFMDEVLEPFRPFVAGLLDDVAVWADSPEELHFRLLKIFSRFCDYGLILNSLKCKLFVNKGVFLGFLVSNEGISIDPQKVSAIQNRPMPKTTSEIRSFIGAANYLRHLIKDFSKIVGPLIDISTGPKNTPITLSDDAKKSWLSIRNALTSTPVLRKFDWRLPIVLECDASNKFVGAALLQPYMHKLVDHSTLHPVSYFSHKLNDTQQRYSAQERELLCILLALQHWRHWVEGGDVTVITDHESLKSLSTKTEQPARILRFIDSIEHYNVRIVYRKGKANVLADFLSRPPISVFPVDEEDGIGDDQPLDLENIELPEQLNRVDLQCIFEYFSLGQQLPSKITPDWVNKNFAIHNEKLHRIKQSPQTNPGDPPGPSGVAILLEVLEYDDLVSTAKQIHENLGHASAGTSMREASRKYWHPNLILAVYEAIQTCSSCQLMRPPDPALGNLTPLLPAPPLTRWGIDHTQIGTGILLNAVEYATGWLESRFVPSTNFENTIPLLLHIIRNFGVPKQLISDNAGSFAGVEAKDFQNKYKINVTHTTPARPRGNGKVEQANGVLKAILTRMLLDNPKLTLSNALAHAVTIYNRRESPTGYSPYFLLFGTQPPEQEQAYPNYTREATELEERQWTEELVKFHQAPIARSYVNSMKATRAMTRAYLQENKALMRTYVPGDWVLRVRQRKHKFEPYYDGPWAISSCHAGNTYSLISPGGFKLINRYNGTNLFPAYVRDNHPVRSLWYGSRNMLQKDRENIRALAGM